MASWTETREEFQTWPKLGNGQPDVDGFRRAKYKALADHTGRPLIVYATDFLNREKVQLAKGEVQIDLSDRDGVREVTRLLKSEAIDLIIQSPGGSPTAADTIVQALRRRYKHIRIFVPGVAKSAATMIALSGNELLLEADAELGPIDPQMGIPRGDGSVVWAPAQAIIDQFENAQKLIGGDAKRLGAWIPILQQYGPSLYQECRNAIVLSKRYVRDWLQTGMLANEQPAKRSAAAAKVVNYLGEHNKFMSHGARIGIDELRKKLPAAKCLNDDPQLCERVMAVFEAVRLTLEITRAFKLWENSNGQAFIRLVQVQQLMMPPGMMPMLQQLVPVPQQPTQPPPQPAPAKPAS